MYRVLVAWGRGNKYCIIIDNLEKLVIPIRPSSRSNVLQVTGRCRSFFQKKKEKEKEQQIN